MSFPVGMVRGKGYPPRRNPGASPRTERARRLAGRDLGRGPHAQAPPFARPYAPGVIAPALADANKPRASRERQDWITDRLLYLWIVGDEDSF